MKAVNGVLGGLCLEKHPDKTFIGRIERGFNFLGYHFSREGLTVAKATIRKFVARAIRLYEQEQGEAEASSRFGLPGLEFKCGGGLDGRWRGCSYKTHYMGERVW